MDDRPGAVAEQGRTRRPNIVVMSTDVLAGRAALTTLSEEETAFRDAVTSFAEEEVRLTRPLPPA